MNTPTRQQLEILWHSLGLDCHGHGREYRNYYCLPVDQYRGSDIKALVDAGFMIAGNKINQGSDQYFYVTDEGMKIARKNSDPTPKLNRSQRRYRAYLKTDCSATFEQYLTSSYWAPHRKAHGV